jgi:hypothetical protein
MNLYNLFEAPKITPAQGTTGVMDNQVQSAVSPIGSGTSRWEQKKKPVTMMGVGNNGVVAEARDVQLDEISNKILGDYKKAAGADATAADKAGDIERGNKRFRGIVKATVKQGENDAKRHKEQGVAEANDPNFVGFMNKALGDKVDPKREQPKTGHDWYDNAPTMSMDNMPSYKHAFKFGMSVLQSMDAETKQHFAEADNDELFSYLMKLAEKKGFSPKYFVIEDMIEVPYLFREIFHDPAMQDWEWADLLRSTLKEQGVSESLGRATPKMPKARDPGHAVLAAKRGSGAAGQHTNKKRQAVLQPKHQKPLTRDMDLGEGWKSTLGGAALAGAMALGAGGAQAQSAGDQYQPNMVAHITYSVNGQNVTKDINLGSQYGSARAASDAVTNMLKSKGIKYFSLDIKRVGDDQVQKDYMATTPASDASGPGSIDTRPYRATAPSSKDDYMVREELDESIERRLMQMRHAGYDI